jgi:hypothetical protein
MEGREMETRPPVLVERVVRFLTPPSAREEVVGDLSERYRSPVQYLGDATVTVPFVIASQIRRSSNLPVLGLQAFILFTCLGGFVAEVAEPPMWMRAAIPTATGFVGLVLRDAYRTADAHSIRRAVVDGLVAVLCVALSQAILLGLTVSGGLKSGWLLAPQLAILGLLAPPMLSLLRVGLGLDGDAGRTPAGAVSKADLANEYARFQRGVRARNAAELTIGIACIAFTAFFLARFQPAVAPFGWAMLAIHTFAMSWIAIRGWVRRMPVDAGRDRLLLQYQRELTRMRQIRQYLWWWYFVPLFVGLLTNLILPGIGAADPARILPGIGAGLLLGFCIAGLNHDRSRKVREKVDTLSRMRAVS